MLAERQRAATLRDDDYRHRPRTRCAATRPAQNRAARCAGGQGAARGESVVLRLAVKAKLQSVHLGGCGERETEAGMTHVANWGERTRELLGEMGHVAGQIEKLAESSVVGCYTKQR